MKTKMYAGLTAILLLATGCQEDEMFVPSNNGSNTYRAVIEQPNDVSRSSVTDEGKFSWVNGDPIAVIAKNAENTYVVEKQTLTVANEATEGTFMVTGTEPTYAVYPQIIAESSIDTDGKPTKVTLPAEYKDYDGSTNAAMLALFETGTANSTEQVVFKHLGAVMRIRFNSVPAGYNQFVFTATGMNISGEFTIDYTTDASNPQIAVATGSNNSVTFNFAAAETDRSMTFYIPLPVGTYTKFTAELKNTVTSQTYSKEATKENYEIKRQQLALLPEISDEVPATKGLFYSTDEGSTWIPYPETIESTFDAVTTLKLKTITGGFLTPDIIYDLIKSKPTELTTLDMKDATYKDADGNFSGTVAFPSHRTNSEHSPFNYGNENSKLETIIVPDNVTKIYAAGKNYTTFKATNVHPNLKEIKWNEEKVTELNCYRLTGTNQSLTIPSLAKVETIGPFTFQYTTMKGTLDLSSCTSIGLHAFYGITTDLAVQFGTDVTIDDWAFSSGKATIAENGYQYVTAVGERAFTSNTAIKAFIDCSNIESVGDYAFAYTNISGVKIGSKLKVINAGAFTGSRTNFKSIDFTDVNPDLVIRQFAFRNDDMLEEVNVTAKLMHPTAFIGIKNIKKLNFNEGLLLYEYAKNAEGHFDYNNMTNITTFVPNIVNENVLYNLEKTTLYAYWNKESETTFEIPNTVETIGYEAFYLNQTLTTITFEKRTEGNETVVLSDGYADGGINHSVAFCGMAKLKEIDMSNIKMESIGGRTFFSCKALEKVSLPQGLQTIYSQAFSTCSALKEIYCNTETPPALKKGTGEDDKEDYFLKCGEDIKDSGIKKVYVPSGSLNAYKASEFGTKLLALGYDFLELPVQPAE